MNFAEIFSTGLSYTDFLTRFGTDDHRRRWQATHDLVRLQPAQKELLQGFRRQMQVLVVAGAWCGDCVNQCPIFDHFSAATPMIQIRYFDRDAAAELAKELSICGAPRVPSLLFLSEDGFPCGRAGDRTLSIYRDKAAKQLGATCPTGLVPMSGSLLENTVQEWLNEFERIQWMLRTSSRLREKHGD